MSILLDNEIVGPNGIIDLNENLFIDDDDDTAEQSLFADIDLTLDSEEQYEVSSNGYLINNTNNNIAIVISKTPDYSSSFSHLIRYKQELLFKLVPYVISDLKSRSYTKENSKTLKELWKYGFRNPSIKIEDLEIKWIDRALPFFISHETYGEAVKTVYDFPWYNSDSFKSNILYYEIDPSTDERYIYDEPNYQNSFAILLSNDIYGLYNITSVEDEKRYKGRRRPRFNINKAVDKSVISRFLTYGTSPVEYNNSARIEWVSCDTDFTIVKNGTYQDIMFFDDIKWITA